MHVEASGSKSAAVCPRSASSAAGLLRRAPAVLAAALGALSPGMARAQFETFVDVTAPSGVAVADTGEVAAVVGEPNRLVRYSPDGAPVAVAPLSDDLARSRIALGRWESFQGAVILSPTGTLEIVPAAEGQDGTVFELANADDPLEVQAPDLDATGTSAPLTLAGARFDDIAIAPPLAAAQGAQSPLELFVAGATAGTGANGEGARPFLVRLRVDLATQQGEVTGIATTQGDASDPRSPSGVGLSYVLDENGAPSGTVVVTSLPSATHASDQGAGWTLVMVGAEFPEDDRPEAAPQWLQEEQRIISPGMGHDDQGNLYMIVSVGACEGSEGPGLRVSSATETLCAPLPATTAFGSADVGVWKAGDFIYVNDEEGNAIVAAAAPPNVTPPASPAAARGWFAPGTAAR